MTKLHSIASAVLLSATTLLSVPSYASDSTSSRESAATRYFRLVPTARMMDDAFEELGQQMPVEKRDTFLRNARKSIDAKRIEDVSRAAMIQTFTADEINALADFHSSKNGASAMKKFSQYMLLVIPTIQEEISKTMMAPPEQ